MRMYDKSPDIESYSGNDYRNYLEHYGIRGMRWGVRKADAYDAIYYRSRYNNKKVQAYKDLKDKKIGKAKFVSKRVGQVAGNQFIDPVKQAVRSLGRDTRGWYRLITGKTYRKSNEQEFRPAGDRAMSQIKSEKDKKALERMVQQSLSEDNVVNTPYGSVNAGPNYEAIYDYLDSISMKEIERYKRGG